jgi:uncharacterized protein (TIGR03382 family)
MSVDDFLLGLRLNSLGLMVSVMIAATCGFLGVYVVLKRIVFVGVSLAQVSSAGVALAFLIGPLLAAGAHRAIHSTWPFNYLTVCMEWIAVTPMAVSLAVTLAAVVVFAKSSSGRRIPREAVIGIGYVVASALTLLFILRSPKGMEDVRELFDGSVLTVGTGHVAALGAVYAVVILVHTLFFRQILFVSFDPEMAASRGYQVHRWEMLFYLTLGATISVSIQQAGLLSVFSMMLIPAATGLTACRRMLGVIAVAVASAVVSAAVGFALALLWDLPVSPPTIAASAALLGASALVRRRR